MMVAKNRVIVFLLALAIGGAAAIAAAPSAPSPAPLPPPDQPVPPPTPPMPPSPIGVIAEVCYELAAAAGKFSQTPTTLCAVPLQGHEYRLTLRHGPLGSQEMVAQFDYALLERARCIDCNKDIYGSASDDQVTALLKIKFNGLIDSKTGVERGRVTIGTSQFFYKKIPSR